MVGRGEPGDRSAVPGHQVQVAWSPALLAYDFGPAHPLSPLRLSLTMRLAHELGVLDVPGVRLVAAQPVADAVLGLVHDAGYLAAVRAASAGGAADLPHGLGTEDTPVFPGMHEAAARLVGGSVDAAVAVWRGQVQHAVNLAGGLHHARPARASGFCVYNDAAVAIQVLLGEGARRVAYIDLDGHHGDGVETVFWDDPRVLTVSLHESGDTLFPGTGRAEETGGPRAPGTVVNVALPARTGDAGWLWAFDAVVPRVVRSFGAEVVVSQHGCDAHRSDPMTSLRMTVDGQRRAAQLVHELSHDVADGRWVALGGGGYAVVEVVARVWTHLLAIAAHATLGPATPVPGGWRAAAGALGAQAPSTMSDGADAVRGSWRAGECPAEPLGRCVRATLDAWSAARAERPVVS